LPSYLKFEAINEFIKYFNNIGFDYLSFTKIDCCADEIEAKSIMMTISLTEKKPIIIGTNGSDIPHDLILSAAEPLMERKKAFII